MTPLLVSCIQRQPSDTEALWRDAEGLVVHLKGYGFVKVFRTVSRDGNAAHWATDDLQMAEATRNDLEARGWGIEVSPRGIKQYCGVEQAPVRKAAEQKSHLLMALRAFLRLEVHRLQTRINWYGAKTCIVREAIRLIWLGSSSIQVTCVSPKDI